MQHTYYLVSNDNLCWKHTVTDEFPTQLISLVEKNKDYNVENYIFTFSIYENKISCSDSKYYNMLSPDDFIKYYNFGLRLCNTLRYVIECPKLFDIAVDIEDIIYRAYDIYKHYNMRVEDFSTTITYDNAIQYFEDLKTQDETYLIDMFILFIKKYNMNNLDAFKYILSIYNLGMQRGDVLSTEFCNRA